jgi:hypothetical protein
MTRRFSYDSHAQPSPVVLASHVQEKALASRALFEIWPFGERMSVGMLFTVFAFSGSIGFGILFKI